MTQICPETHEMQSSHEFYSVKIVKLTFVLRRKEFGGKVALPKKCPTKAISHKLRERTFSVLKESSAALKRSLLSSRWFLMKSAKL